MTRFEDVDTCDSVIAINVEDDLEETVGVNLVAELGLAGVKTDGQDVGVPVVPNPHAYIGALPRLRPASATLISMGFYYSPGTPDPKKEKSGGFRETLAITWVVFRVLAVPIGILLGVVLAFFVIFYLFTLSPFAGLGGIAAIILALVARGVWEAKHPPELP